MTEMLTVIACVFCGVNLVLASQAMAEVAALRGEVHSLRVRLESHQHHHDDIIY